MRHHVPHMQLCAAIAVLVLACSWGCGSSEPSEFTQDGNVVHVPDGDAEMIAAMKTAKATLDEFITKLGGVKEPEFAMVKYAFAEDGQTEHVWVLGVTYESGRFRGRLADDQYHLPGLKSGMELVVPRDRVSDWAIVRADGSMEGGYTNRVLEKRGRGGG